MKKLIIALGIVVLIIAAIALAGMYKFNYLANQEGYNVDGNQINKTSEYKNNSEKTEEIITEEKVSVISLEEVAKHSSEEDCWGAINGKVYDVTAFFGKHPGGDKNLFRVCGIDATKTFEGQHGGNTKVNSKLETFYIGDLQ